MAAIAKARAAADTAEQRADRHDAEAARTVDDAPRETKAARRSATPPSGQGADTPPQPAAASTHGEPALPTYDARAHRDPFTPPRLNSTANARTPLETYQLGQLKLVGVVAQPPLGYRAMVEDSAGLGYIITTGTPIGSSGGVVRSIESRRVVIEESIRDFYGDMKPKEVVMELPQEDRSP
ncbi:MAG: pilus assembly protein PilP [Deltaproteobacteria bacterium]|nr:pilus assembly protein PilP [Deltaproteobacteria bacterium]